MPSRHKVLNTLPSCVASELSSKYICHCSQTQYCLWAGILIFFCYRYRSLYSGIYIALISIFLDKILGGSLPKTSLSLGCQFYITIGTVAVFILMFLICITITFLVITEFSRNLVCNDCGWDGALPLLVFLLRTWNYLHLHLCMPSKSMFLCRCPYAYAFASYRGNHSECFKLQFYFEINKI